MRLRKRILFAVIFSALVHGQSKPSADELFKEAQQQAVGTKDFSKAEFWLRELHTAYPQDARGGIPLLEVLEIQNKLPEAIAFSREIRTQFRADPMFYLTTGRILAKQKLEQQALAEFETGLRYATAPAIQAGLYNLIGDVHRRLGEADDAIQAFEQAKKLTGKPSVMLALAYTDKGDRSRAIKEYEAALALDPNQPVVLNNLAYSYAETGQSLNQALQYARRAVANSPGNSVYVDTLAWVLFKQGQLLEAESEQLKALKMEAGTRGALLDHLAAVMDARGVWTPERKEVRELLDSDLSPRRMARLKDLLVDLQ